MPYQENHNNNQDVTPEEYLRLLAIQRRVLQSEGGVTPRFSQGDVTSFPQQQMMQSQRMMQSLHGMDYQAHGAGNASQMHGRNGGLSHSMPFNSTSHQFHSGGNNMMANNMPHPNRNESPSRSSLSRSLDSRFNASGFDGDRMSPSISNRMSGPVPRKDDVNLHSSTQSDGILYGHSMITQRLMGSDNDKITTQKSVQNDNNTVDLTDDLAQASAGVLSPLAYGKRRRLNSDELVKEWLGEYAPTDDIGTQRSKSQDVMNCNDGSNDISKCLSPFSRRTEAFCSPLTPLDQTKTRGFAETDSPMGQTPIMFAQFFLTADEKDEQGNKVMSGIPLPPLYQSETGPRPSGSRKFVFNDVHFNPDTSDHDSTPKTPFSSEPLCLPPRRKKKTTPKPKKKLATKSSSGSGTSNSSCKNSPIKSPNKQSGEAPSSPTLGNIISPSSAAIFTPYTEIRNQMQSSPGSNNGASPKSAGKPTLDDSNRSNDEGFSVPQFATIMEASQFSQQSIHDWDRKFGLRRAHSKTMRESARSRKNVLEFLKGDGSELLNSALSAGLKQSTASTATTSYAHSLSGSSFMTQEEENKAQVQIKVEETDEASEEDKSQEGTPNEAIVSGAFQVPIKEECVDDDDSIGFESSEVDKSQEGVPIKEECVDDDNSIGFGSIGSFDHDDGARQEDEVNDRSHDFNSSYTSKILELDVDMDEELTNMFRRASLDHMPENLRSAALGIHRRSSSVIMPTVEEPEYKQCFAKSA